MAPWRTAATVILRNVAHEVLMLQRGPTARFMPNSYVFPGGILDEHADRHFPVARTNFDEESSLFRCVGVESELALRVAASRELFEEAGLLMLTDPHTRERCAVTVEEEPRLAEWRQRVRDDPRKFVDLFTHDKLDLDSLIPWSNWLTPASYPKRFDTYFFIVQLDDAATVHFCDREMSGAKWAIPSDFIADSHEHDLALPPPQFYELARVRLIGSARKTSDDDDEVSDDPRHLMRKMGAPDVICPQVAVNADRPGTRTTLLPGDFLFAADVAATGAPLRSLTDAELEAPEGAPVHRIAFSEHPMYTKLHLDVRNATALPKRVHLFQYNEDEAEARQRILNELWSSPRKRR